MYMHLKDSTWTILQYIYTLYINYTDMVDTKNIYTTVYTVYKRIQLNIAYTILYYTLYLYRIDYTTYIYGIHNNITYTNPILPVIGIRYYLSISS